MGGWERERKGETNAPSLEDPAMGQMAAKLKKKPFSIVERVSLRAISFPRVCSPRASRKL